MADYKMKIEEAKTDVNMGPTQTGRMVVLKEMKDSMGKVFIQFDCSGFTEFEIIGMLTHYTDVLNDYMKNANGGLEGI